jgi:hypothetical protein
MTNLFLIIFNSFWLGFQIFANSLKSFISAPVRLIDKRGSICDHSHFVNRNVCLLFGKIFVVNFDRGLSLTYKIFSLAFKMA